MGRRDLLFVALIVAGAGMLAASLVPARGPAPAAPRADRPDLADVAGRVDEALGRRRHGAGPAPAARADDLAILRRLSLGLTGTIPSLEAIRRFEVRPADGRLAAWLDEALADNRASDYLAERLARAFVGTEGGPFLVYRRRRLVAWLSDQLRANRPYDAIVRDLIATEGVWTDHPATNFISVTLDPDREVVDPERLAARVARAFLGARIDCAQCHDHPFQPWTRADFRGLAAYFGQVRYSMAGITDGAGEFHAPTGRPDATGPAVAPRVPFLPELDAGPGSGSRRERLARWATSPRNGHFSRATANRAWALLFGRPLVEPVDDLAAADDPPAALDVLADDFAAHGFDLRRLLRVIAATRAFALDSAAADDAADAAWDAFPITRLRPEQLAGALTQAASAGTIGADSPLLSRLIAAGAIGDFVAAHGDRGADEFAPAGTSTIPQRLLLMNGDLVGKYVHEDFVNLSGRIAAFAPDDRGAVEAAYLAALTRRPTPAEAAHFASRLADARGNERRARVADLLWALLNSTEFSYNH